MSTFWLAPTDIIYARPNHTTLRTAMRLLPLLALLVLVGQLGYVVGIQLLNTTRVVQLSPSSHTQTAFLLASSPHIDG
jgi:hypothetical protein